MTAQPVSSSAARPVLPTSKNSEADTQFYLRILAIWHGLLALASLVGVIVSWVGVDLPVWMRVLLSALMLGSLAANGAAALNIIRTQHAGRVISLIVNYLVFTVCFVGLLHLMRVFIAIDDLANTFPKGLPYLGIALVGYLIRSFGDRFEGRSADQYSLFARIGNLTMAVGGGLFLLVSILLPAANYVLTDWVSPLTVGLGLGGVLAAGVIAWRVQSTSLRAVGSILLLLALGMVFCSIALMQEFDSLLMVMLLVGTVITAILMWMMWRAPTALAMHATISGTEMLEGLMFLSPNLLGFLLFFAGPLLFSLYVSFTEWDAFGTQEWIGLRNYADIFNLNIGALSTRTQTFGEVMDTSRYAELVRFGLFGNHYVIGAQDKLFWISLWNTLLFGILSVPLSVAPALLLAVILNSKLRGMTFFRAVYFLPSIAAVVGVALIWRWLYNSTVGWINYFITGFISLINTLAGSQLLTDPQIGWLSDTNVALLAVVIVAAWQWVGFNTVLFLAGLQGIPGDLYEAATVDGAGAWNKFWKITLPMLAPTTFFVVSTRVITAMQLFDQVFVMTNPPGGPGTSTMTVTLHLYRNGFQNFQQGYASAIAWVLFLLIFGVTLAQFQRQRGTMAYDG